jgi:uncharacterized membrane protein YidH (DUF202 family)
VTSAAEEHDAAELEEYEGPDAGMAAERTDLAWSRSGLSLGVCGLIVLKGLPSVTEESSRPLAGAALLVLGGITWALGYWSAHHRRPTAGRPRALATWADLAPAAFGTAAVGVVGLMVVLLSAP